MNAITIISSVINGKLCRNINLIKDAIASFEGKEIELTIKRKRKTRSNSQNAYMWGVLVPLAQQGIKDTWGEVWSTDKTHEFLKAQLLFTEKVNEETGQIIKIPKSTTENTTTEQEEYHSACREFLKEWFNIDCPLPNEEIKLEL